MNIYVELNKIIEYIELHLEEKIDYKEIAKMIGVNDYTFQRLFSLITNVTMTEYIRNRRLSNAGQELYLDNEKIIDIAIKYQYDSPTSFSRAFFKFHGIKPSQVKKKPEKLKMYTKLHFNEESECNKNIEYKIIEKEQMILYGKYKNTTTEKIKKDAPEFFEKMHEKCGYPIYGMVEYEDQERRYVKRYWVLYDERIKGLEQVIIPQSKWIEIKIKSNESKDIQEASETFYKEFLPSCKYCLKDLPELEFYHDNVTDFLIPIEE